MGFKEEFQKKADEAIKWCRENDGRILMRCFAVKRHYGWEVVDKTTAKNAISCTVEHSFYYRAEKDLLYSLTILTINGHEHREWCGEDRGPKRQHFLNRVCGK